MAEDTTSEVGKESVPADFFHCDHQFLENFLKSILHYPLEDEQRCERLAQQLCQYTFANKGVPLSQQQLSKLVDKIKQRRGHD